LTAVYSSLSPFVSKGFIYLEESEEKVPISVLRDTGATQSLILDSVLPFSGKSSIGISSTTTDECHQGSYLFTVRCDLRHCYSWATTHPKCDWHFNDFGK